jgi:hypothetical protein
MRLISKHTGRRHFRACDGFIDSIRYPRPSNDEFSDGTQLTSKLQSEPGNILRAIWSPTVVGAWKSSLEIATLDDATAGARRMEMVFSVELSQKIVFSARKVLRVITGRLIDAHCVIFVRCDQEG